VEYVQVAETPTGQRYTVVTAPPGSGLDAGGRSAPAESSERLLRSGWASPEPHGEVGGSPSRLAMGRTGRPGRPIENESANQEAAEARSAAVVLAIRSGRWPEPPPAPTGG
jgi:hypothetical protein